MLDLSFKEDTFKNMTDEELAAISSDNSTAVSELVSRYAKLIWIKANIMANSASDAEDLAQEGLLGLLNAISKFDSERSVKFSTFAEVCISNRMRTILDRNRSVPVVETDSSDIGNEEAVLPDTPESIFIEKEHLSQLYNEIISLLSNREWKIFTLFLQGLSYKNIAEKLNISEKSVDNAIQRIRRKLKSRWNNDM